MIDFQQGRREFIQKAILAGTTIPAMGSGLGASVTFAAKGSTSPNEKLNLAAIGTAARAAADIKGCATENIVALCDIDDHRLAAAKKIYTKAKTYNDYRKVLDRDDLDGVIIGTPDHMHAIPISAALKRGLPVYCEKPLTHSVYEADYIRKLSAKAGVATQMGNQIHSGDNYRRVVETIEQGIIGQVRRVHVWLGGGGRFITDGKRAKVNNPPKYVHYDLWLGPAPFRPYDASSFHFNWRYWWDFGNGQLGDFCCHYMDLPFWALKLGQPTTVHAVGEKAHNGENECPYKMKADYHFPARGDLPAVHMTWYHGGWKPEGAEDYKKNSAVLFEGDDGRLIADYGSHKVFMEEGKEAETVKPYIKNSIGHHQEWIAAIKHGSPTGSNFAYGALLTGVSLLGNVSYRAGQKKLVWDAENLRATNLPEADQFIRRDYRKGWSL